MEVFVQEQRVPEEEELDSLDSIAVHLLALLNGDPVGTARLIPRGEGYARIGRMAVRAPYRDQGIGTALMNALLDLACSREVDQVDLAAQLHAIPFYERLHFVTEGGIFLDGGIEHRMMTRRLY